MFVALLLVDPDPYVFGPLDPGSGTVIILNGSGSTVTKKCTTDIDFYCFVTLF
jgi:hypothetical protein